MGKISLATILVDKFKLEPIKLNFSSPAAYAFDYLSILEVKGMIKPSEDTDNNYNLCIKELKEQLTNDYFYKIKGSREYRNLVDTNRDIYIAVEKAKNNLVSASYVDYLNWVRWIHKSKLQDKFFEDINNELKFGYEEWICIEMDNTHLFGLLDAEDYEICKKYKWSLGSSGYICGMGPIHRFIMAKHFDIDGKIIDHLNGNRLDNRKSNLRVCNEHENRANSFKSRRNKSGYKGVHLVKKTGRWQTNIIYQGKWFKVGSFIDKEEAAIAFDIYAKILHKDFAKLNFETPNQEKLKNVVNYLLFTKETGNVSSKYYGVSYEERLKKWVASIRLDKQFHYLGRYDVEEEAARTVDKKLIELGKLHKLNFNRKLNDMQQIIKNTYYDLIKND